MIQATIGVDVSAERYNEFVAAGWRADWRIGGKEDDRPCDYSFVRVDQGPSRVKEIGRHMMYGLSQHPVSAGRATMPPS